LLIVGEKSVIASTSSVDQTKTRTQFLATCLLNGGKAKEAEELIRSVAAECGPELKHCLALAYARQGKTDEAVITYLEILDKAPEDAAAKKAAIALLHRQAVCMINARNWTAAGAALGDALKIDAQNREIQQLLSRIENVLPVALLVAGKRTEAAEAWEKAWRQRPENGELAHSLALLYYNLAASQESDGKPAEAEPLWNKAMAYWTLVRYNDIFWAVWCGNRRAVYPIAPEALVGLRRDWVEGLDKSLRGCGTDSETGGKSKQAQRRRSLLTRYWLEQVTACTLYELRKVLCPGCRCLTVAVPDEQGRLVCEGAGCRKALPQFLPAHSLPAAGPELLRQLGAEKKVQELLKTAAQLPNGGLLSDNVKNLLKGLDHPALKTNAGVLRYCVSSAGAAMALAVNGRLEEAIAALEKLPAAKEKGRASEREALLLYACLERGKQLAAALPELPPDPDDGTASGYVSAVKAALQVWKKGIAFREADKGLADQLRERVDNLGNRGGNEFFFRAGTCGNKGQFVRAIALLKKGIEILEFAIEIERGARAVETVSVLYADRGLYEFKNGETDAALDRAIAELEKARKYSAQNARAKELMAQFKNQKGVRLLKPYEGQYAPPAPRWVLQSAQQLFNAAVDLDPTDRTFRENLRIVTRALGGF